MMNYKTSIIISKNINSADYKHLLTSLNLDVFLFKKNGLNCKKEHKENTAEYTIFSLTLPQQRMLITNVSRLVRCSVVAVSGNINTLIIEVYNEECL